MGSDREGKEFDVVTKTEPYDANINNYDTNSTGYDNKGTKMFIRDRKGRGGGGGIDRNYKYNPKPLGKKNSRQFVPEERKTEDYWQKRIKNNVAARKSREDRRRKELETLNKQAHYEKENLQLRMLIDKVQSENQYLLYEVTLLREEKKCPKF